jgi:hypothetical protein
MKEAEKLETLRKEYLAVLVELGGLSVDRASHLPSDMGMNSLRSPQDAEESKKIVAKINRQIAENCNRMRAIEQRARGGIGIPTLLGQDVPNVIRVAVAILAGKSLSGSWGHECRSLGGLLQPAGGSDPEDVLVVREAFRKSGVLRPHIHSEPGRTLDELGHLTLTEVAFRKLLSLEPDGECEDWLRAKALVAVTGKR